MIDKKFLYMVINGFGQPLYRRGEKEKAGNGMCWFFVSTPDAVNYIKYRRSLGLDLDKERFIVRTEWKDIFKAGKKVTYHLYDH